MQKGAQKFATAPDTSPHLTTAETKQIQSTTGSFLYYVRAIDYTILPALNNFASAQAQTTILKKKAKRLMDYIHTYPNAYIRFYARDMIIHIDSNAAYLLDPNARSRIARCFHILDHTNITKHP